MDNLRRDLMEALDAYPLRDPRLRRLRPGEIEGIVDLVLRVLSRAGNGYSVKLESE